MNKSYYFPHDYNSTNDPKIICLLNEYGGYGYGAYWRIIEILHQEKENKLPLKEYIYTSLVNQLGGNPLDLKNLVKNCIENYELFSSDGEYFWSNRVNKNIVFRKDILIKRQEAGKKGALLRWGIANANSKIANCSKGNKRKGNKSKYIYNNKEMELAKLLEELIINNTPTYKKKNLESWANTIRLMVEYDKRTHEQIEFIIHWCQKDNFWQANILSANKLREKFDTLVAQIKRNKPLII